jgi:serine/threonine protein kinase
LFLSRFFNLFYTPTKTTSSTGNEIYAEFIRDLKPENFLFENKSESSLIKIIDFGLSTSYLESVEQDGGKAKKVMAKLKTCAGTSLYMAPEVIMKQYSVACDLWSAGVILYIMLAGFPPFYGDNDIEVFEKIINYQYDFDGKFPGLIFFR